MALDDRASRDVNDWISSNSHTVIGSFLLQSACISTRNTRVRVYRIILAPYKFQELLGGFLGVHLQVNGCYGHCKVFDTVAIKLPVSEQETSCKIPTKFIPLC